MQTRHKILKHAREIASKEGALGRFRCIHDDDEGVTYIAEFIRFSGHVIVEIGYDSDRGTGWMFNVQSDYSSLSLVYNVSVRRGTSRVRDDL